MWSNNVSHITAVRDYLLTKTNTLSAYDSNLFYRCCTSTRYKSKTNEFVELHGDIPEFENNQIFMLDYLSGTLIEIPDVYSLAPAYPNPFNPVTTLSYGLPEDALVYIQVYDLLGKNVATLVNDNKTAGFHKYIWNADTQASGVYFIVMNAGKFTQKQKILLVK